MAETADNRGYWLVASDGGVFSFGDAKFYGSLGGQHLNRPIVGIASTAVGGYWLLGAGGGIYGFGKAHSHGSVVIDTPGVTASAISGTPDGEGYTVLQSDGLIRTFGDAQVPVSYPPSPPVMVPAVGLATTPHGTGNWVVDANGHVLAFGGAALQGSADGIAQPGSVVSVAASDAQRLLARFERRRRLQLRNRTVRRLPRGAAPQPTNRRDRCCRLNEESARVVHSRCVSVR